MNFQKKYHDNKLNYFDLIKNGYSNNMSGGVPPFGGNYHSYYVMLQITDP